MKKFLKKYADKLEKNSENKRRRVGIEIEYSNLSLEKSAKIIQELFGGEIEKNGKYTIDVTGARFGTFHLELDAELLQEMDEMNIFEHLNIFKDSNNSIEKMIDKTAEHIVPFEIACPPVDFRDLDEIEKIVEQLRYAGALGTTDSIQYAFGVQFNVEPRSLDIETILNYFKSFLILQNWIEEQSEIDIARKVTPFINDYPKDYLKLVFREDYAPSQEKFIDDYINYNPTRNRVLDMLPLLAFLDEKRVRDVLPDEKINKRPTFHYRLPNSKINLFRWDLYQEWELWLIVEVLSLREDTIKELGKEYRENLDSILSNNQKWLERSHKWVLDLLSQ